MSIGRTTAVFLASGLLIAGASAPIWSAMPASDALTVAQATSAGATIEAAPAALVSQDLRPSQTRDTDDHCKPGHLYSADNVVGDPQACIKGVVSGVGARPTMGSVP